MRLSNYVLAPFRMSTHATGALRGVLWKEEKEGPIFPKERQCFVLRLEKRLV